MPQPVTSISVASAPSLNSKPEICRLAKVSRFSDPSQVTLIFVCAQTTFPSGEIIVGMSAIDTNWWFGHTSDGREGIFPTSLVWPVDLPPTQVSKSVVVFTRKIDFNVLNIRTEPIWKPAVRQEASADHPGPGGSTAGRIELEERWRTDRHWRSGR